MSEAAKQENRKHGTMDLLMFLRLLLNISNLLRQLLERVFIGRVLKLELCPGTQPSVSFGSGIISTR